MTVQNALEEMKERAFAPAFQKYLFDTYKVLAQTDFSEEEKDYTAAEYYFTTTLEQSENEILSQIKTNYEAKLRYASRYAFHAGLYSGFVQHFSNQDLVVDGFEKHLMQALFEMPGMQRHTLFLQMHNENQKLIEQLEIDGDEERLSVRGSNAFIGRPATASTAVIVLRSKFLLLLMALMPLT